MKDLVQIWNRVTGRQYSSVSCNDKELKDLSNRVKTLDTNFDSTSVCEGLGRLEDVQFNEKKIINRLFKKQKNGIISRKPKCLFLLFLLGFILLGVGFAIVFLHPYDLIYRWKLLLSNRGEIYEMWRKPEVKLYTRVFLFNVTNAEEFMAGTDDKIKVKEVGPFVYREALEHSNVTFNDNGTLSSIPRHPLMWEEELSMGNKEDDILFLPHIALLSIANVVSPQSFMTRFGLNNLIGITNSQPLAKMTAKEFMMGYKSELMTLGNTFMPGWIYFDKLGLIDRMYDFEGDYETIFTGEKDLSLAGLIDTYRGSTDLPQWNGKHCSNVQYASDGTKFKGNVQGNESILFFRKSLCRAAPLIPVEEGIKNGLTGYKYMFPEHMLDNGKNIKENKCFCRNGKCLPEGLIDVTDCYYGFPIALSYPHFYKGDDILFSKVEGLTPNKEDHETSFWIQPSSGLPLDISSKFQINMALDDISGIKNADRFANMYLPLLWFDIRMYTLPKSMEIKFRFYINILPIVETVLMYLSFIAGTILILVTSYILTFKIMFKNYNKNNFKSNVWLDKNKHTNKQINKDGVYSPCEIPLSSDTENEKFNDRLIDSENDDSNNEGEKEKFINTDKIKEFTHKLFDFDRKNSLINKHETNDETNEAYKSDSSESDKNGKSEYLEVLDDGSDFDYYDDRSKHKDLHINIE